MRKTTFGSYIRALRLQNQMTQSQLADKLNVTDKAVSKWERDLSYPDITLFPKLADLLGVSVNDLLNENIGEIQPSRLEQIFEMSHDFRTPLHIILGCADMAENHYEDKELLFRYLRSIRISGEYLLQTINRAMDAAGQAVEYPRTGEADGNYVELKRSLTEQRRSSQDRYRSYDFSDKRILIAEDVELNREIAGEIVKQTGATAEFAEDGQVCLDKVMSAPEGYYDLILMDIMMPNMDGLESARRIRQLPDKKKAAIPIIAVSANVHERDRNAAFDAGMDAFTEKPILIDKLLEEMKKHLQLGKGVL